MRDQVLGLPVIAFDSHGRPVVRDKARRSYLVLDNGRFSPLHSNPSHPSRTERDRWMNCLGQQEKERP